MPSTPRRRSVRAAEPASKFSPSAVAAPVAKVAKKPAARRSSTAASKVDAEAEAESSAAAPAAAAAAAASPAKVRTPALVAAPVAAPAASVAHAKGPVYEFGGPIGAVGIIVGLPLVIFALYHLACKERVLLWDVMAFDWKAAAAALPSTTSAFAKTFMTREAAIMFFGWLALQVVFERVLPGDVAEGVELADKRGRLSYTMYV
jgi:hypothetical protein